MAQKCTRRAPDSSGNAPHIEHLGGPLNPQDSQQESAFQEKPAGHPDRSVDHYDRSQRRPYGKHFLRPDSNPPPRARVYQGRGGDWGVSIWFRSETEARDFARVAEAIPRKGARL
jgi:hypothetical protein